VGVGEKPKEYDLADYVLGHFSKAEQELLDDSRKQATRAVELILQDELQTAMNEFNRKKKEEQA
jgi:PTH1 family peptidyl-tRNA hydrolase